MSSRGRSASWPKAGSLSPQPTFPTPACLKQLASYFLSREGQGPQSVSSKVQEGEDRVPFLLGPKAGWGAPGGGSGLLAGPGTRARGTRGLSKRAPARPPAHLELRTAGSVTDLGGLGKPPQNHTALVEPSRTGLESRPGP